MRHQFGKISHSTDHLLATFLTDKNACVGYAKDFTHNRHQSFFYQHNHLGIILPLDRGEKYVSLGEIKQDETYSKMRTPHDEFGELEYLYPLLETYLYRASEHIDVNHAKEYLIKHLPHKDIEAFARNYLSNNNSILYSTQLIELYKPNLTIEFPEQLHKDLHF